MLLKALTDGSVAGTGQVTVESRILGGILITADGTNNATVVIRKTDSNGKQLFEIATKTPIFVAGPFALEGAQALYYDISGTAAAAQLYEWVE